MKTIIIGSTRLKQLYPEFPREPSDIDYATSEEIRSEQKGIEYLYNPVLCDYLGDREADGNTLLTLKISHLFYEKAWDKHLWDALWLLDKGNVVNDKLLDDLIAFWTNYLPRIRRSDLSMNKEDFFTNKVNEDVDEHDFLHTLLNPVPMYTRLLKDGSEVQLDENKWHFLTDEQKDAVVFEETAVMAFERYPDIYYKKGFVRQLRSNIIKHFPKFIALWAIYNYKRIHIAKIDYLSIIKNGIRQNQRNLIGA